MIARIVIQPGVFGPQAQVSCPYRFKDIPKSFPGRRYDSGRKCWVLGLEQVDHVANVLRRAGCEVFITNADGSAWASGAPNHGNRGTPARDWVEAAFASCPVGNVARLRRGLLSALHPDAGGDAALAVRINGAADRAMGKESGRG